MLFGEVLSSSSRIKMFTNKKINVELDEMNFMLWKHQVLLIVRSHRLERLLTGALKPPPELVADENGAMIPNEDYEDFVAQDSALASCLEHCVTIICYEIIDNSYEFALQTAVSQESIVPTVGQIVSILKGLPREYQTFMALAGFAAQEEVILENVNIARGFESTKDGSHSYSQYHRSHQPTNSGGRSSGRTGRGRGRFSRSQSGKEGTSRDHVSSGPVQDEWVVDLGATHHVTPKSGNITHRVERGGPGKLMVDDVLSLHNLLSVSKFSRDNRVYFEFHAHGCCVRDVLLRGRVEGGLYVFSGDPGSGAGRSAAAHLVVVANSFSLWHRRLGHAMYSTVANVCKTLDVMLSKDMNNMCEACCISKSHKLPFVGSTTVYNKPFQLVFTDIWGPAHVMSNDRSQVVAVFKQFQKMVLTQFGMPVKVVQSDWGVLLAQAAMPLRLWYYVTVTAVYIINRLPTKVLDRVSPLEKLWGKKPEYELMRVFGWYSPQHKGYMCLATEEEFIYRAGGAAVGVEPVTYSLREDLAHEEMTEVAEDEFSSLNVDIDQHNATDDQHNAIDDQHNACDGGNVHQANEDSSVHGSVDLEARNAVETISNHHPMLMRSKCGVFKPKVYSVTYDTMKPVNVHEALQSPHWKNVVHIELKALKANDTWSLVPLPEGWSVVGWPSSCIRLMLTTPSCMETYIKIYSCNNHLDLSKGLLMVPCELDAQIEEVVKLLSDEFALKDLGELSYFLGIETKMHNAEVVSTPMLVTSRLAQDDGELLSDAYEYRSIVGALLYAFHIRPGISFSVNKVTQYMHAPRHEHFVVVKRILRYLVGTLNHGLVIAPAVTCMHVVAFVDANIDDRKSITGNCIFVGDNLVMWSLKKQKSVSRSTMEAEYRSVTDATAEIKWVSALLADMGVDRKAVGKVAATSRVLRVSFRFWKQGRHGGTPLHHAAKRGLLNTVKLLLSHGANPLAMNDDCQTPLDVAREKGNINVVRAIEEHICLFSGWMREFYGPGFIEIFVPQLVSRKVWVVVLPTGSRNHTTPLKLGLAIYSSLEDTLITEVEPYIHFNINPSGMQPVLTTTYLLAFPSIVAR
ncbi:putative E3 ubiquitin-protein ligase XBAT35 [Hibiscus syriacus]|uniref:E3 ubiquitin-protein ligase XBAT35 n=2 Tax=Hibiscus syriacus TaxID=106335 RepID=A0A6A3CR31_HIBSY|nr:putative E3 ubiquitin-protein ligase XBAT35 [Hibiscus syriacus]